jgi:hypothetical protein
MLTRIFVRVNSNFPESVLSNDVIGKYLLGGKVSSEIRKNPFA